MDLLLRLGTTTPFWGTTPLYSTIRSTLDAGLKPGGVRAVARVAAAIRPVTENEETIMKRMRQAQQRRATITNRYVSENFKLEDVKEEKKRSRGI